MSKKSLKSIQSNFPDNQYLIFSLFIKNLMRKKEEDSIKIHRLTELYYLKDPSYRERDILSVRMNYSCVAIEIRNILLLRYRNRGGGYRGRT